MTTIIIGAYALISIPLNIALGHYEVARSRAYPVIFTLAVILVKLVVDWGTHRFEHR